MRVFVDESAQLFQSAQRAAFGAAATDDFQQWWRIQL